MNFDVLFSLIIKSHEKNGKEQYLEEKAEADPLVIFVIAPFQRILCLVHPRVCNIKTDPLPEGTKDGNRFQGRLVRNYVFFSDLGIVQVEWIQQYVLSTSYQMKISFALSLLKYLVAIYLCNSSLQYQIFLKLFLHNVGMYRLFRCKNIHDVGLDCEIWPGRQVRSNKLIFFSSDINLLEI